MTKLITVVLAMVFTFGLILIPKNAEATVYFAKKELQPLMGWYVYGGVEVLGVQVPVGFVIDAGGDFIGMKEDCAHWSISTCDDSNLRFWTIMTLNSPTPQ